MKLTALIDAITELPHQIAAVVELAESSRLEHMERIVSERLRRKDEQIAALKAELAVERIMRRGD